ncbi:hypothetical protein C8P68_1078 [Mucilaginibacter yixingensis]|uniref:Uncharacterized protein n=2 Tax=Mucilaginibacter yixingensis TaxID=1295612 RepID=A0A2T5J652_9SPHI|nr:hypothetical protein C8P68_1078 [Mucilaginibacter yixingensis]
MLNELSLSTQGNRREAENSLETFIAAATNAGSHGFTQLRLHEGAIQTLYQIPLAENFNIDHWLKDGNVNSDYKDKFRLLLSSFPLFGDEELEAATELNNSEFKHQLDTDESIAYGLGAAYLFDTLAISLITHNCWKKSFIDLSHYYITASGNDQTTSVKVKHFYDEKSFDEHLDWWKEQQVDSLNKANELWDKRDELFKNLIFSPEVQVSLKRIGFSKFFYQIIDRLKALDSFAANWKQGAFETKEVNETTNLRISTESDLTLRSYGTLRKFTVEGKGKKVFDHHIKTGELRFHFYPDNSNHKIYVGYIGPHLKTWLFK